MKWFRTIWVAMLSVLIALPLLLQTQAHAAQGIVIYINDVKLRTDRAPILVSGRAMLPLRAIFEALDADVDWNNKTKTVTAIKGSSTVVLKIGSKTATINGRSTTLDVTAQNIKGRTMVPVRFVSEALGETVDWNPTTKTVYITTGSGNESVTAEPVAYVTTRDISDYGDGRDLEVSFSKPNNLSVIDHYRVLVVKANKNLNLSQALRVSSANYTSVSVGSVDPSVRLSEKSRDTDGALIRADQAYKVYVLSVGKGSVASALSNPSSSITLGAAKSVESVSNVRVNDISDYGDGRDLYVTFTKPSKDSDIASYRVFVVKTRDASKFNLAAANALGSQYYTTVNKSGNTTHSVGLSSSARDTDGDYIKNGVSYTVFVQSISNNTAVASHRLSSASSSIMLTAGSIEAPVITRVYDESDYGDGRDLRVSFRKLSDESKISGYRVFVVKSSNSSNFNLARANNVSSSNYTEWSKDGYNFDRTLPSGARDVDGETIRNGVSYRVFVMAVGSGNYSGSNTLSASSSTITLLNNYSVGKVSNLSVSDVSDYGDGRDLRVSFYRASDESNISHYRILVVKASKAGSFNLASANAVSNDKYYTYVNRGGNNSYYQSVLSSGARDVDGDVIRNGTGYRVFVLSVGSGSYSNTNALSAASSTITLSNNYNSVGKVSGLEVKDVADYNDGRDLQVSFNRATDESNIHYYSILVVKTGSANNFNLSKANAAVSNGNFIRVDKNGGHLTKQLPSNARDVDGALIRNGVSYRVFVLSVGYGSTQQNALSNYSAAITLTSNSVLTPVNGLAASVTGNYGDGRDIQVKFTRSTSEDRIAEHRIMIVPANQYFGREEANAVHSGNYTQVSAGSDFNQNLKASVRDVNGNALVKGEPYKIFVLSVAKGDSPYLNALAGSSGEIRLNAIDPYAPAVSGVTAIQDPASTNLVVSFTKPSDEKGIAYYAVFVVPAGEGFTEERANSIGSHLYKVVQKGGAPIVTFIGRDASSDISADLDVREAPITTGVSYQVYVLSIADGTNATANRLSSPSNSVLLNSLLPQSAPQQPQEQQQQPQEQQQQQQEQ